MSVPLWIWICVTGFLIALAVDFLVAYRFPRRSLWTSLANVLVHALLGVQITLALVAGVRPSTGAAFITAWMSSLVVTTDHVFVLSLIVSLAPARFPVGRLVWASIVIGLLVRAVSTGFAEDGVLSWVPLLAGVVLLGQAASFFADGDRGRRPLRRSSSLWVLPAGCLVTGVFAWVSITSAMQVTENTYLAIAASGIALPMIRSEFGLFHGVLDRLSGSSTALAVILAFVGVKLVADAVTPAAVAASPALIALSVSIIGTALAGAAVVTAVQAETPGRG